MYTDGVLPDYSKLFCMSVPKDFFIVANKENEILQFARFHVGFNCLPKNPFMGFQYGEVKPVIIMPSILTRMFSTPGHEQYFMLKIDLPIADSRSKQHMKIEK